MKSLQGPPPTSLLIGQLEAINMLEEEEEIMSF